MYILSPPPRSPLPTHKRVRGFYYCLSCCQQDPPRLLGQVKNTPACVERIPHPSEHQDRGDQSDLWPWGQWPCWLTGGLSETSCPAPGFCLLWLQWLLPGSGSSVVPRPPVPISTPTTEVVPPCAQMTNLLPAKRKWQGGLREDLSTGGLSQPCLWPPHVPAFSLPRAAEVYTRVCRAALQTEP